MKTLHILAYSRANFLIERIFRAINAIPVKIVYNIDHDGKLYNDYMVDDATFQKIRNYKKRG